MWKRFRQVLPVALFIIGGARFRGLAADSFNRLWFSLPICGLIGLFLANPKVRCLDYVFGREQPRED